MPGGNIVQEDFFRFHVQYFAQNSVCQTYILKNDMDKQMPAMKRKTFSPVMMSKSDRVCDRISLWCGIAAAVFIAGFLISLLLLDKDCHWIWRLDEWILHAGFLSVVLSLAFKMGNIRWPWWRKTLFMAGKLLAIVLLLFCWLLVFFCIAGGSRPWHDNQYAVYEESKLRGSEYVLYKRQGAVERKCFGLFYEEYFIKKISVMVDEKQDQVDARYWPRNEPDSLNRRFIYRLSTGERLNVNELEINGRPPQRL